MEEKVKVEKVTKVKVKVREIEKEKEKAKETRVVLLVSVFTMKKANFVPLELNANISLILMR